MYLPLFLCSVPFLLTFSLTIYPFPLNWCPFHLLYVPYIFLKAFHQHYFLFHLFHVLCAYQLFPVLHFCIFYFPSKFFNLFISCPSTFFTSAHFNFLSTSTKRNIFGGFYSLSRGIFWCNGCTMFIFCPL